MRSSVLVFLKMTMVVLLVAVAGVTATFQTTEFIRHWGGRFEMDCDSNQIRQHPIKVGDRIPDVTLSTMEYGKIDRVSTMDMLEDRRVVLFSVTGAFHPESEKNLKNYIRRVRTYLDNHGVDSFIVVTTDEPHTIEGRLHSAYFNDVPHLHILEVFSDVNAELVKACGLVDDRRDEGFGFRWRGMSAIVDDGVITALNVDVDHVHQTTHLEALHEELEKLPPYVHKYQKKRK